MKKLICLALAFSAILIYPAFDHKGYGTGTGDNPKDHAVRGHVTKKGRYVAPHRQTNPNDTKLDNYSTKGNLNPHTGKEGTKDPYKE